MTTPVILLFAYSKFSQILLNLFVGKGDVMCGIHSPVDKKKKKSILLFVPLFPETSRAEFWPASVSKPISHSTSRNLSYFILPFLNPYLVSLSSTWVPVFLSLIWISSTLRIHDWIIISHTQASLGIPLHLPGSPPIVLWQAFLIPCTTCLWMAHINSLLFSAQEITLVIFFFPEEAVWVMATLVSQVVLPIHSGTFLERLIKHWFPLL